MPNKVNSKTAGILLSFSRHFHRISCKHFLTASIVFFSFQLSFAQTSVVKGKVTSGDTALANVTVQVKGLKTATQTNLDGEFSIAASPTSTLIFTAIGYTPLEVKVNNRMVVNVQLESSSKVLDQVVVVG